MTSMTDEAFVAGIAFILAFVELDPHGGAEARATLEASLDEGKDGFSKSNQKRGLQSAIGGCLEQSNSWYPYQVEKLDAQLRDRGVPTLCEIRLEYSKKTHQLLGRKRTRSFEEFNYLASMLGSGLLTLDQQATAKELLAEAGGKPASGVIFGRHLLKG